MHLCQILIPKWLIKNISPVQCFHFVGLSGGNGAWLWGVFSVAVGPMQSSSWSLEWQWHFFIKLFLWHDFGHCLWKPSLKPISPTKKVHYNVIKNFIYIFSWILIFTLPHSTSYASAWEPRSAERALSMPSHFYLSSSSSLSSCGTGAGKMDEEKKECLPNWCLCSSLFYSIPLSVAWV